MSATTKTVADFVESGAAAHVSFRVRCETLGHGEEVFLLGMDAPPTKLPLYTTPSQYPWYQTAAPLILTLPAQGSKSSAVAAGSVASQTQQQQQANPAPGAGATAAAAAAATASSVKASNSNSSSKKFAYRYAVYRAGVFYRWERPSDGPAAQDGDDDEEMRKVTSTAAGIKLVADDDDVARDEQRALQDSDHPNELVHTVPLRLLANRESYIVNDVLGVTTGPPNIEHIRLHHHHTTYTAAIDTLHSDGSKAKAAAAAAAAAAGTAPPSSTPAHSPAGTPSSSKSRKKHVGFTSTQPHYHLKAATTTKQAVHLNSTDGLVVVSVFLPVIMQRSPEGVWSADWDYEMLLSMQTHLRVTRVGIVKWKQPMANQQQQPNQPQGSGPPEAGIPRNERHLVEECLRPMNCVPVWVDPVMFGEMYNGFCKGVLWPVLHNVTSVYANRPEETDVHMASDSEEGAQGGQFSEYSMDDYEQGPLHGGRGHEAELWSAYNSVNRQFADAVVQNFNEGDLVWIHGFHLLILPSYLTRRVPMAKLGIFLHTPFPSSEIFRTLWCREDLLRGILNADQVGFHLFEYARHFLTSCRRLLGLSYGMIPDSSGGHTLAIDTNGRNVVVTSIHAGVEQPVLRQILAHRFTQEKAESIRQRFQGKHIFCGIDRLESLKGIPFKLLGLERCLKRCPEWVGKVVLIQVGISAFERGDDYFRTKNEVTKLVQKINNTWPGTVQFQECQESEMPLQQRMALLRAADTVVVTSIRDGLNLLPLEFTIAHQDAYEMATAKRPDTSGRKRGICILSEFSSSTRVMRGALHVNPWKIAENAIAMHQALTMTEDERLRRIGIASEFVTRVTTQRWALAVMLDLKGVNKNMNPDNYSGAGLGLGYRLLGMHTGFSSLDSGEVAKAYKNSKARLILLDYGGTIVNNDNLNNLTRFQMVKEKSPHSLPTDLMISTLKDLCQDKRNTVFVVSGKERHSLTKSLGDIPNLGLAAEHGMFISWPTSKPASKRRWETLVPETDRTWRSLATTIMEVYTSRTHGSYIEETEMKVLWQYRDADTEFGFFQAKELEDHLAKYLRSFSVDVLLSGMEEGGYVEVRPKGVNKGVLAMRVIRRFPEIAQKERVDFALVLGDDHCDEPMLSVMRQVGRRVIGARKALRGEDPLPDMPATIQLVDVSSCDNYVSPDMEVFTCTVGKKPSAAANYLHDVDEVQELLSSLVKVSARDQRYHSSVDLRSYTGTVEQLSAGALVRPVSTSMPLAKSLSLNQMGGFDVHDGQSNPQQDWQRESTSSVPANINEFLRLGTIEDDDDDDAFFF